MQEIDYTFRKLFAIDSDFNRIREEIHNKLESMVADLDSLTISKITTFKQEFKESQKVMYELKEKGDQLAKDYIKFINSSSEVFFVSDEVSELEDHHRMDILDAATANNYLYLQRNGKDLSQEQIDILQDNISLYKELRDQLKKRTLLIEKKEMILADSINEKDSELSNLIRNFIDNLKNISSNNPKTISNNVQKNNSSSNSNNTSNRYKYCTRCGTKLNSDALFCSNCGNKFSEVNDNSTKILEVNNKSSVSNSVSNSNVHFHDESFHLHSNSRSDFCCPNCGSENVQSLPIIYQSGSSGTSSVTQTTQFIGISQGNTMTDLARAVAPPQRKKEPSGFGFLVILGIGSLLVEIIPAAIVFFVLAVIAYFPLAKVKKYNKEQFPIEYDNWKNSYLCHRCGTVFRK